MSFPNPYTSTTNDLLLAIANALDSANPLTYKEVPNVYKDTTKDLLLCILARLANTESGASWLLGGNTVGGFDKKLGTIDDYPIPFTVNDVVRALLSKEAFFDPSNERFAIGFGNGQSTFFGGNPNGTRLLEILQNFGTAGGIQPSITFSNVALPGGTNANKTVFQSNGEWYYYTGNNIRIKLTPAGLFEFFNNANNRYFSSNNVGDIFLPLLPNLSSLGTDANGKIIAAGGGGGGSVQTLTKAQLDTAITNSTLTPGAYYFITGVDVNLYGGTTVLLQATSTNKIGSVGYGLFYAPPYSDGNMMMWMSTRSYGVNDYVFWGGYKWVNQTGSTGNSINMFSLDATNWTKVPYNNTDYNVFWDEIKYNYSTNRITYRRDNLGNIVDGVDWAIGLGYGNPIQFFKWGCSEGDVRDCKIINSYFECINLYGVASNIQLLEECLFNINTQVGFYSLNNITLQNGSSIVDLTIDDFGGSAYATFLRNVNIYNSVIESLQIKGSGLNGLKVGKQSNITGLSFFNGAENKSLIFGEYCNINSVYITDPFIIDKLTIGSYVTIYDAPINATNSKIADGCSINSLNFFTLSNTTLGEGLNIGDCWLFFSNVKVGKNTIFSAVYRTDFFNCNIGENNLISNLNNLNFTNLNTLQGSTVSQIDNNNAIEQSFFENIYIGIYSIFSDIIKDNGRMVLVNNITIGNNSKITNISSDNEVPGFGEITLGDNSELDNIIFASGAPYEIRRVTLGNNSIFKLTTTSTFTINEDLRNLTVENNTTFTGNITAATTIYQTYPKTIFTRQDGTVRLRYWNNSDVQVIVDVDN